MASSASTRRRDVMIILALQGVFIVAFFMCSRYDPQLGPTVPSTDTPALDHYYPRK
jgi:hypothetical protein